MGLAHRRAGSAGVSGRTSSRWAGPLGQGRRRVAGRVERVVMVACGVFSITVLIATAAARPGPPTMPGARPTQATTQRGDPALAATLADRAKAASDPQQAVRLLIAAYVLAPDQVGPRLDLAAAVLDAAEPVRLVQGELDDGPVHFAELASGGSYLVVDGDGGVGLWQLRGYDYLFRLAKRFDTPVLTASGGQGAIATRFLVNGPAGVDLWTIATTMIGATVQHSAHLADHADAIAVGPDANIGVTVDGTAATVWDFATGGHTAAMSLTYDQPVTSIDLSMVNDKPVLAVGHADGSVTLDRLDLDRGSSTRQTLTGGPHPVATVTVSAAGAQVLAIGTDGTATIWANTSTSARTGTVRIGGTGPYRAWLAGDGSYATVTSASDPPELWSLADPIHPTTLATLPLGANPAVPAMATSDGRTLVTIDHQGTVDAWDIRSIVDILANPIPAACGRAALTDETWKQLVANPTYPNPCPSTASSPYASGQPGAEAKR